MGGFLKRLLFRVYVLFVRRRADDHAPTLIWKYAWFFMWHRFFWSLGRVIIARYREVPKLIGEEISARARAHYDAFNALAARDYQALPLTGKLMRPTRYVLAPDTARELCLFYHCIASTAPWQYGAEARLIAKQRMRNRFLLCVLAFMVSCYFYAPHVALSVWSGYLLFNLLLVTGAGWYADSCLHILAREGERLAANEKKHLE